MDLFDTLIWAEILEKTIFLDTPTLTVLTCKGKICTTLDMQIVSMWHHLGIPVRLLTFEEKNHLNCYLKKLD
jgi:hypothetical protein